MQPVFYPPQLKHIQSRVPEERENRTSHEIFDNRQVTENSREQTTQAERKHRETHSKDTNRNFNTIPAKCLIMLPSFPGHPRRT